MTRKQMENAAESSSQFVGVSSSTTSSSRSSSREPPQHSNIGNPSSLVCSSCGEQGHRDARNSQCKNKKKNKRGSMQAGDNSGPSGEAFHHTWTKVKKPPIQVLSQNEAAEIVRVNTMSHNHVQAMVEKLDHEWQRAGKTLENLKELDVFLAIAREGITLMWRWMEERVNVANLTKNAGILKVREWEFYSFLAMLFNLMLVGTEKTINFAKLRRSCADPEDSRAILSDARFDELQRYLAGFVDYCPATSSSHADVTDPTGKFDKLEDALSEFCLRVVPDAWTRVTIDDRNLGTNSASNPKNTYRPRKRHKNGAGSDACADSSFRLLLYNKLYGNHYNQNASLDALLEKVKSAAGGVAGDAQSMELILDRAYGKVALYLKCAKEGYWLVVINDKVHHGGNPFMADSVSKAKGLDTLPGFLVTDGPKEGGQIFTAKKSLTRISGTPVAAHAFAVREFGDESATHVHRFVVLAPPHLTSAFSSSMVMEPLPRVKASVARSWLFYPEKELQVEDFDDDSDFEPSDEDYSEESDDYYVNVENVDNDGENDEDKDDTEHDTEGAGGGGSQANQVEISEDIPPTQILPSSEFDDSDLDEDFESLYTDEVPSREVIEAILKERVNPLTAGQRCADWFTFRKFMVTGTTAQAIALHNEGVRSVLVDPANATKAQVPQPLTTSDVAEKLFNSWFHTKKANEGSKANRYLIIGTRNEAGVVHELRKKDYVLAAFEIGLVQSQQLPGLGVSADNVLIVVPPGKDPTVPQNRVLVPLEIKTKCTLKTKKGPLEIKRKYGTEYLECVAGTPKWFEVVPREHRGQLLHQAVVFRTRHSVFCVANVRSVVYSVFITYPESVLESWREALRPVQEGHLTWAWKALSEKNEKPSIPIHFSEDQRYVIKTHFPLWLALHKRRIQNGGVLEPIRVIRSLVQFYYSKGKQGVDGVDDYAQRFDTRALNLDWEKKVTTGKLRDALINAGLLWRMYKVAKSETPWKGLDHFRNRCSRFTTMTSFADAIVDQLIRHANYLKSQSMNPSPIPGPTAGSPPNAKRYRSLTPEEKENLRIKDGRRNVIAIANTSPVKRLRLSDEFHQEMSLPEKRNALCVVCGTHARRRCKLCNVVLHVRPKHSTKQSVSCWSQWHRNESLKRRKLTKKPKQNQ